MEHLPLKVYPDDKCRWGFTVACNDCVMERSNRRSERHVHFNLPILQPVIIWQDYACDYCQRKGVVEPAFLPYCVITFMENEEDQIRCEGRSFALDRAYNLIGEHYFITMHDRNHFIESDRRFFPTYEHQSPKWARELRDQSIPHVARWTDYYEEGREF